MYTHQILQCNGLQQPTYLYLVEQQVFLFSPPSQSSHQYIFILYCFLLFIILQLATLLSKVEWLHTFATKYLCDQAWENRSYLHRIHLLALSSLQFYMCYPISVSFIEFLMDYAHVMTFQVQYGLQIKSYQLHFKLSKSRQILHVDKTSFPRPGHLQQLLLAS